MPPSASTTYDVSSAQRAFVLKSPGDSMWMPTEGNPTLIFAGIPDPSPSHEVSIGNGEKGPRIFNSGVPRPQIQPQFRPGDYNVGTRLAHRLEELGVTDYFAVPGDFNLTLLDEILKNKSLRMIGCCNELNAGYAADGYARSSPGRVAVIVVTFMVGGLSLINAIAGAYSEDLRVVIISGCPPQSKLGPDEMVHHTLGTAEKDQTVKMFKQVTAASVRLTSTNPAQTIDDAIGRCLDTSRPVYIEIPMDLAQMPCDAPRPLPPNPPTLCKTPHTAPTIKSIISVWKAARKPMLLFGPYVRRTVVPDLLVDLIDKLGCPACVQPDGKSVIPEDHPQVLGTFWSKASEPACEKAVLDSDLWFMVGCRWTDLHTFGGIDLEKESYRLLDLQDGLATMPNGESFRGVPLNALIEGLVESDIPCNDAFRPCITTVPATLNGAMDENSPLSLPIILRGIQTIVDENSSIFADAGDSWFNAQLIKLPRGAGFQIQMIYCSIGWSLPATLGYHVGRPDKRAILMIGDGSFQMTGQELSTMIRLRLNPIIFIFNNLGYAVETAIHDGPYNYYTNWNYASFANSLCNTFHSIPAENPHFDNEIVESCSNPRMFSAQIKTTTDLLMALARAQREPEKLALLECCIKPHDISPALRRFGKGFGGGEENGTNGEV
ncbi:thiamine diphosphate-binding protein [Aspergillus floccosus]